MKFECHPDVFKCREGSEQVVRLENKTEPFSQCVDLSGSGLVQRLSEDVQMPLLNPAERADQRQERGLSRPALSRHDHDLAWLHLQVVLIKHLFSGVPAAVVVIDPTNVDRGGAIKPSVGNHTFRFKPPKKLPGG